MKPRRIAKVIFVLSIFTITGLFLERITSSSKKPYLYDRIKLPEISTGPIGLLQLYTIPADAIVYDRQSRKRLYRTPLSNALTQAGVREFMIVKNGYETLEVQINIEKKGETRKSYNLVELAPGKGNVGDVIKLDLFSGSSMEMCWVPPDNNSDNCDGFWMGRHEITRSIWKAVMGYQAGNYTEDFDPLNPVRGISFDEAKQFVVTLNRFFKNGRFALPLYSQWKHAAFYGSPEENYIKDKSWFAGNRAGFVKPVRSFPKFWEFRLPYGSNIDLYEGICRIGQFQPNSLGLHDMFGNVAEWSIPVKNPDENVNTSSKKNVVSINLLDVISPSAVIVGPSYLTGKEYYLNTGYVVNPHTRFKDVGLRIIRYPQKKDDPI